MRRFLKWAGIAAGAIVACVLAAFAYIYVASEIIADRTYPIPPSHLHVAATRRAVTNGARLVEIYGCTDCHGSDLTGIHFSDAPPGMVLWSRNLRLVAKHYSDAEFDRAVRTGLRADGTSVVVMPSDSYAAMRDDEVSDIVAYLRSLPAKGVEHPPVALGFEMRLALVLGQFHTARMLLGSAKHALDLGPKYAMGRHIAQIACTECHNDDLSGRPGFAGMAGPPDLSIVASYERADFLRLMHTGKAAGNRELPFMSNTARQRFSHFTDAEANALYDYLVARGHAMMASK